MKVIFLDFNGVMVSGKSPIVGYNMFDKDSVSSLNNIIKETGASIVVSSGWRLCSDLLQLSDLLQSCGVKGEILDTTPFVLRTGGDVKGTEIDKWLKEWKGEPIESFVILDDDPKIVLHKDKQVKTNYWEGLTEEDANKAKEILNAI